MATAPLVNRTPLAWGKRELTWKYDGKGEAHPRAAEAAVLAFYRWGNASCGRLSFRHVLEFEHADIVVDWKEMREWPHDPVVSTQFPGGNCSPRRVHLNTLFRFKSNLDPVWRRIRFGADVAWLEASLLQGVGWALGMAGNPSFGSVMNRMAWQDDNPISEADAARLRELYPF